MKLKGVHLFIGFVCTAVAASIVAAFFMIGSPAAERARQLDMQRVSELQQIGYAVDTYYGQLNQLPSSLEELRRSSQYVYVNSIADPATMIPYEYAIVDAQNYKLCATFDTVVNSAALDAQTRAYTQMQGSAFWDHSMGNACFTIKVNTPAQKMP